MPSTVLATDLPSPEGTGSGAAAKPASKHTMPEDRQTPRHPSSKDGETGPGFAALMLADIKTPLPEARPTEQSAPAGRIPTANTANTAVPSSRPAVQLELPAPVLAGCPGEDVKSTPARSVPIPTITGPVAATSKTLSLPSAGVRPNISDRPVAHAAAPDSNLAVDTKNLLEVGSDSPREAPRTPPTGITLQAPRMGPDVGRQSDPAPPSFISSAPQQSAPVHSASSASVQSITHPPSHPPHHGTAPAHQLVAAIKSHTNENRLEVRLDPPHLGRLSIEFDLRPDAPIRAVVSAENSDTLSQLRRQSSDLLRELSAAGLEDVDLAFSDSPQDQTSFHHDSSVPIFSYAGDTVTSEPPVPTQPIHRPLSGLDIRL